MDELFVESCDNFYAERDFITDEDSSVSSIRQQPPFLTLSDREISLKVLKTFEKFPEKSFREYQEWSMNEILRTLRTYRYVVLDAPTGSGKSVIGYVCANILNSVNALGSTYFTTPYKVLQDQYLRDFLDMAVMKGTANYACTYGDSNCALARCRIPKYDAKMIGAHSSVCPYSLAKHRAKVNPLTLFNTAAFLTYMNHTTAFPQRLFVVADECHTLEQTLRQFISILFSSHSLERLGIVSEIPAVDEISNRPSQFRPWVEQVHDSVETLYDSILSDIENIAETTGVNQKTLLTKEQADQLSLAGEYLKRTHKFLDTENIDDRFVVSGASFGKQATLEFKPVVVSDYTDKLLFNYGGCFLFMSATVHIDTFCREMGLPRKDVKHIRIPTTFSKQRRPFYVDNRVGALNKKNLEDKLPDILQRIEDIASNYKIYKGIIHTHTYKIAEYILQNASSKLKERLIAHKGGLITHGLTREEAYSEHITRSDATILISPMMFEGVDLHNDLGRWSIIVKVPYLSLVDPQVKKRLEIDPEWYQWQAVLRLVQAYGRTMRSREDWGYTFCLDRSVVRLYSQNMYMFPVWFREAFKVWKVL